MTAERLLQRLAQRLADDGKLIEAGWVGMRLKVIPLDASDAQIEDMRCAFMAGAQHLFGSIMSMLDPGVQGSPGDLRRMAMIDKELRAFARELELRMKTAGRA